MALGPQLPEPSHHGERRLRDQAVFLGDMARSSRPQDTQAKEPSGRPRFGQMLARECEQDEAAEPEAVRVKNQTETDDKEVPGRAEIADDQRENRLDAERQSHRGQQDEAEKASAGLWRGPHPSMGLAMVSAPHQLQAQALEQQGRAQRQRDASETPELDEGQRRVDEALLSDLRQGGLAQPITGLSDPRLKGHPPQLGSPWSCQDPAGVRVYRWEGQAGRRQVLRWSEKEVLLETTAAGQRQVIQQVGDQVWSQTTPWSSEIGFELPRDFRPF